MSKERLEELKRMRLLYEVCFVDDYASAIDDVTADFDLLIKRVQELEKELTYYKMATESYLSMEQENKRYRATINAMGQILKDAIHSLEVGEKVQGLEYGVAMRNEALEGEE